MSKSKETMMMLSFYMEARSLGFSKDVAFELTKVYHKLLLLGAQSDGADNAKQGAGE